MYLTHNKDKIVSKVLTNDLRIKIVTTFVVFTHVFLLTIHHQYEPAYGYAAYDDHQGVTAYEA